MRMRTWIAAGLAAALVAALAPVPEAQDRADLQRIGPRTVADLRQWDVQLDRMLRSGDLVVGRVFGDARVPGRSHERADQFYRGVKVFGGDVVRQIDGGQTVSIFGTLYVGIDLDVSPRLTQEDAKAVLAHFVAQSENAAFEVAPGVRATFLEAGHILGSAGVVLDIEERGRKFRLAFSGDIGRRDLKLLRDPVFPADVDALIMECTYGNKVHKPPQSAFDELREGDQVSFEVADSPKGPNAIKVSRVAPMA